MHRYLRAFLLCTAVGALSSAASAATSNCLPDGLQASGAVYRICMPPDGQWNGDLVIYAHGYVAFNEPIAIPEDQLEVGGISLPEVINALGYGFATTSYSVNGLAIPEALLDVVDLVDVFREQVGEPGRVLIVGASEGGLVTTLAVELYPDIFDGGVAACGPIGSFRWQINTRGDFRIIFDYFFPGVLPGTINGYPDWLIENFELYYQWVIRPTLARPENLTRLIQLISVTHLPYDPANLSATLDKSLRDLLWYNVFGTGDAIAKFGGHPFDNRYRYYTGSNNDAALNAAVERVGADVAALENMAKYYETTGAIGSPLVTIHTLLDQQVPYWHELLYEYKIAQQGKQALFAHLPILRYGHCEFTPTEILVAFAILIYQVDRLDPAAVAGQLESPAARREFNELFEAHKND